MTRATGSTLKGVAERQPDAVKLLAKPGDMALVERGVLRSLVIQCPDGCGDIITVNLDERAGPAWRLYRRSETSELTLYPSVWRDSGCGAHFILWRDRLIWCDGSDDVSWHDPALQHRIHEVLPAANEPPAHFEELASVLGEPPWDVLWECRALARNGIATAYQKNRKFRRTPVHGKEKPHDR